MLVLGVPCPHAPDTIMWFDTRHVCVRRHGAYQCLPKPCGAVVTLPPKAGRGVAEVVSRGARVRALRRKPLETAFRL